MKILLMLLLWAGVTLPHPSGVGGKLAFSPDATLLATADDGASATLKVWDLKQRRLVREWPKRGKVARLTFSPDGSLLVESSPSGLRAYALPSGDLLWEKKGKGPLEVAVSADGAWLATWGSPFGDRAVRVWDARTGAAKAVPWTDAEMEDHRAAWAGATYLVHATNGMLQVWDVTTGETLRRYPMAPDTEWALHPSRPVVAHFTPEDELQTHRLPEWAPLTSVSAPARSHGLKYSPDGQKLLVRAEPWVVVDGTSLQTLLTWQDFGLAWLPPDRVLALTSNALMTPTGQKLGKIPLWLEDGQQLTTADGKVGFSAREQLVRLPDGRSFGPPLKVARVPDKTMGRHPNSYPVRFTPDGQWLVLWRPQGLELVEVTPPR